MIEVTGGSDVGHETTFPHVVKQVIVHVAQATDAVKPVKPRMAHQHTKTKKKGEDGLKATKSVLPAWPRHMRSPTQRDASMRAFKLRALVGARTKFGLSLVFGRSNLIFFGMPCPGKSFDTLQP